jgi:hypothetical protein
MSASAPFFDARWPTLLRVGCYGSLASAALFGVAGALAASISQPGGVLVFLALALPACSGYGIKHRASNALAAFCCCSGVLALLFVIGCLAQLQIEKPTLLCVCDATCSALPPRGPGGGQDPGALRNTTLYSGPSGLCARQGAVLSLMNAYVAIGVLGLLAQFAACGSLCDVRNKWRQEAALLGSEREVQAVVSQAPRSLLYNPNAGATAAAPAPL